jgi:hypothetical protein
MTQRLPSVFHERAVMRLSDELQIVHIASHWARSFHVLGGMVAMLDWKPPVGPIPPTPALARAKKIHILAVQTSAS